MVRMIRSIPTRTGKTQSVLLEIERSRSVPFVTPRKIIIPPSDVTISEPFFLGHDAQVQIELSRLQQKDDRLTAFATNDLVSLPFRQLGYWFGVLFLAVKKAFTNNGLIHFHVKGKNLTWKLERNGAWALDEGRILENLVKIKDV